ncbi:TMEM165/GDT1 family protein [Cellvibrio japonicus]|nr:TMEM165/GDT1 family protein [Cellvibrio japonicus]QEI17742.1 TMEM165/GDT1 family protein [Cellvibrio japonicus]QEI21317.1 TMEM165/GDT1 family protein [Cellvibrio japonicus]
MEALFSSTLAVAIAEIGDKTQLLALFLAARYGRPYLISLGVLVATLVNHALSAWLGAWLVDVIPPHWVPWIISGSFVAIALWLLVPDKEDDDLGRFANYGPFVATLVLFFLAEIGDKTQIATVILAAKYSADFWMTIAVITGTTLGMLIANIPVIFAGKWIMDRLPLNIARKAAFVLFLLLAVLTLVQMT